MRRAVYGGGSSLTPDRKAAELRAMDAITEVLAWLAAQPSLLQRLAADGYISWQPDLFDLTLEVAK
jgi:hypothetical protein